MNSPHPMDSKSYHKLFINFIELTENHAAAGDVPHMKME